MKKLIVISIIFVIVFGFAVFLVIRNKNINISGEDTEISGNINSNSENNQPIIDENASSSSTSTNNLPPSTNKSKGEIILYYGIGCPHCAKVEQYIKENNIKDKISFEEKEVYFNQKNALDLQDKAKKCGLDLNNIGVPFLWDGSQCIIGDQPIIDFFQQKIKGTN